MNGSRRLAVARFALVIFLASAIAPSFVSMHVLDDADCGPSLSHASRASRASVQATQAPETGAGHCAVCHWLRALGHASVLAAIQPVPGSVAAEPIEMSSGHTGSRGSPLEPPSRAPPA